MRKTFKTIEEIIKNCGIILENEKIVIGIPEGDERENSRISDLIITKNFQN